jgi:RHS repeat-associated protein
LFRTGALDDQYETITIDNLEYTYPDNSNQLVKVKDYSNDPQGFKDDTDIDQDDSSNDYSYDDNGNMTRDDNKRIGVIKYNHLNLPTQIDFGTNGRILYLYDATGKKVKKTVETNDDQIPTHYLNGFQYKADELQFFPTAEGYVNISHTKYENGIFEHVVETMENQYSYVYNYLDHLGNIRLSYGKDPSNGVLRIIEENHYYPFGLKHTNYNSDIMIYVKEDEMLKIKLSPNNMKTSYNYKYNGKELQDELGLNMYDYGARNYDPALGRWMNIDPLAETSRRWSPYTFCYNNPLRFVDPDGMQADDWKDKAGNVIEGDALKDVKVYIFHDDNFSEQAMVQYDEAVKKYGEGAVALSNTGTTEGFAQDWGNMDGTPAEVDIMTHGKNQSINVNTETNAQFTATGDGKTNVSGAEAPNVQDLPKPKATLAAATLNIYTCHSADSQPNAHGEGDHAQGSLKGTGKPIAQVFSETFGFKRTFGTAGSVNYNSFLTNLTLPSSSSFMKPYPENGHWLYYTPPAPANTVKR